MTTSWNLIKIVASDSRARRTEHRNRNVLKVHEDFEYRATPLSNRAVDFYRFPSVALKLAQRKHLVPMLLQPRTSADVRQVDDEAAFDDLAAHFFNQLAGGFCRAAGGDQVIHQQYFFAHCDSVGVDLDAVGAVFEFVVVAYGFGGQLAFLADRDEAFVQRVSQRCAEDKAARFDAGDLVDLHVLVALRQLIYRGAKIDRVFEQSGDVAELDALLGIVRDGADTGFDGHDEFSR